MLSTLPPNQTWLTLTRCLHSRLIEAKNTDCPFALEPKFMMKTSIRVIWKWENLKEILLILNFQK